MFRNSFFTTSELHFLCYKPQVINIQLQDSDLFTE
jgi:hypothetical protein